MLGQCAGESLFIDVVVHTVGDSALGPVASGVRIVPTAPHGAQSGARLPHGA